MPAVVTTRPHISEMLIIRALNTPSGSGGVYRWIHAAEKDILRAARTLAPKNKIGNARHRGGVTGTYKASFVGMDRGSRGHHLVITVHNTAKHAYIVEFGRPSTRGKKFEAFSWVQYPKRPLIYTEGTFGRKGQKTLERAFYKAMSHKRRAFITAGIR